MAHLLSSKSDIKRKLRKSCLQARETIPEVLRRQASENLFKGLNGLEVAEKSVIAGYWAIGSEISLRPLLRILHAEGFVLVLPVVEKREKELSFRQWTPDTLMKTGTFGITEPDDTAATFVPDVLMVPLLAFDGRGYRLGYGGGYYDRTLAELQKNRDITTIGVAFAAQQIDELPNEPHDVPLDMILTENGLDRF